MRKVGIALALILIAVGIAAMFFPVGDEGAGVRDATVGETDEEKGPEGKPPAPMPEESGDKPSGSSTELSLPTVTEHEIPTGARVVDAAGAQAVVSSTQESLGLGAGSELSVGKSSADELGNTYFEVQQRYRGIEVYGARSVLEVSDGEVGQLYGTWVQDLELDVAPAFEALEALRRALLESGVPENRVAGDIHEPRLIVYLSEEGAALAWLAQFALTNPDAPLETFVVDAHVPKVLARQAVVRH